MIHQFYVINLSQKFNSKLLKMYYIYGTKIISLLLKMLNRLKIIEKHIKILLLISFFCQTVQAQQYGQEQDNMFSKDKLPTQSNTVNNPYSSPPKSPNEKILAKNKEQVGTKNYTKEQLRTAKQYAKYSFFRFLKSIDQQQETREIIVDLLEWSYDDTNERYLIRYHIEFESMEENFAGLQWEGQNYTMELTCDYDGKNARLINIKNKKKYIYQDIIPKKPVYYQPEE